MSKVKSLLSSPAMERGTGRRLLDTLRGKDEEKMQTLKKSDQNDTKRISFWENSVQETIFVSSFDN